MSNQKIISTFDDNEAEDCLLRVPPETLVIFDYNDSIVTDEDIFFSGNNKKFFDRAAENLKRTVGEEKFNKLRAKINEKSAWRLVNPKWPRVISKLQSEDEKVLLLTAYGTRKIGCGEHAEDVRIRETLNFGIDFSKLWEHFETTSFENFSINNFGYGRPMFKKGILFSCGLGKGHVLKIFLDHFKFRPEKIIFIDDDLRNISAVSEVCAELNISYLGIEYTKVRKLNRFDMSFEETEKHFHELIKSIESEEID